MSSLREDTFNSGFREGMIKGREEGREEGIIRAREEIAKEIAGLIISSAKETNKSVDEIINSNLIPDNLKEAIRKEISGKTCD